MNTATKTINGAGVGILFVEKYLRIVEGLE
jgi:hypothetical protein